MTATVCPRCHEPVPADAEYRDWPAMAGRVPATLLIHRRSDGRRCRAHLGPLLPNTCTDQRRHGTLEHSSSTLSAANEPPGVLSDE